tara:strand:- start:11696 stop:12526 length:831 start_codon:yes stop_codon:yes gene_type:complete
MTKLKHNKKRNTAFLYEVLVREITKCIVENNAPKKQTIVSVVKEYFTKDSYLKKELDLYRTVLETRKLKVHTAEKLLNEVKKEHDKLDKKELFNEQTRLINKINKSISKDVFDNFVPSYKSIATVYQLFNHEEMPMKERVLLEGALVDNMLLSKKKKQEATSQLKPIDNIVYKKFVENFNSTYDNLNEKQTNLLRHFVNSVNDEGKLQFNVYLNEEIGRIKDVLTEASTAQGHDEDVKKKISSVFEILENMKSQRLTDKSLVTIMKVQELAEELEV